jgi:putative ABC transport system permease protein
MFLNTILLALRSIRRNLLRSFLTILGIVIGVSAVITMVTLGNGATAAVQAQISSLGTNLLQIRPGQRMSFGGGGGAGTASFKEADAEAIASQIGGVQAVAPEGRASAVVVANGRNWSSSVTGSTNAWLRTNNWTLAAGRQFEEGELQAGSAVCIIGETVRRNCSTHAMRLENICASSSFPVRLSVCWGRKGRLPWAMIRMMWC